LRATLHSTKPPPHPPGRDLPVPTIFNSEVVIINNYFWVVSRQHKATEKSEKSQIFLLSRIDDFGVFGTCFVRLIHFWLILAQHQDEPKVAQTCEASQGLAKKVYFCVHFWAKSETTLPKVHFLGTLFGAFGKWPISSEGPENHSDTRALFEKFTDKSEKCASVWMIFVWVEMTQGSFFVRSKGQKCTFLKSAYFLRKPWLPSQKGGHDSLKKCAYF